MKNPESAVVFDREFAATYDNRFAKLASINDSLHLLIQAILSELPSDAKILCVGVGTGSELISLAQAFTQWQFTAVEPAAPMLDICRQRVEEHGFTSRCTFHEGYLDSLTASDSFNAATCLVVSHFIMQLEQRRNFFHQIALRLHPQGYLISSDIAYDMAAPTYPDLLDKWSQMMKYAGIPDEEVEKMRNAQGRDVAVLPPSVVAATIAAGGFDSPVLFFQNLLIHAWYARKI